MGKSFRHDSKNERWRKAKHSKQPKHKNFNPLRPMKDRGTDGLDNTLEGTTSFLNLNGL
jgi:hypothetical protein